MLLLILMLDSIASQGGFFLVHVSTDYVSAAPTPCQVTAPPSPTLHSHPSLKSWFMCVRCSTARARPTAPLTRATPCSCTDRASSRPRRQSLYAYSTIQHIAFTDQKRSLIMDSSSTVKHHFVMM